METALEKNRTNKEEIGLSFLIIFFSSVFIKIGGISLWPTTKGFTVLWATSVVILLQLIGNFLFCRLLYKGVKLSFLMPLSSAVIPLFASAIGILYHGESVSVLKVVLLIAACSLIGVAGRLK